jgi:hypothetical protein
LGVRGRLADSEDPKEIETAPLFRQDCKARLKLKIHPRRKPRMQSSRTNGIHHRPNRRCESGKPEAASAATLKNRNPGRTGNLLLGTTEGPKRQGELVPGQSEEPETKEDSG